MTSTKRGPERALRGEIERLPSGSLRVRVHGGEDALTGKRLRVSKTIPKGHPDAEKEAEKVLTRLLNELDEQRSPRTNATVNQLMDLYLEQLDVEETTRHGYELYINGYIRPALGKITLAKLNGETLDKFYASLRACRDRCGGRSFVQHRTDETHECDKRCRPHKCKPLATSSIRQIHTCLRGALKRARRWNWITVNPLDHAEPPKSATADPNPPNPRQAAAILNEAFKDLDWGVLVWLTMTTGARRGEIAAILLNQLDLERGTLSIRSSIAQRDAETWEKSTKTHQQRRIALDDDTVAILRAYLAKRVKDAESVGIKIAKTGRLFSPSVDHSDWIKPATITQRFRRMCKRLGWDIHIHQLRHYSATELIAAGVDARTVAGRLGHSGGGSTTLRVYSAWVSEADQRAAGSLASHMPKPPMTFERTPTIVQTAPSADDPYHKIAADLRGAIAVGAYKEGDPIPPLVDLAARYQVTSSTVHRAIKLLQSKSLLSSGRGTRIKVLGTTQEAVNAEIVTLQPKRKAT